MPTTNTAENGLKLNNPYLWSDVTLRGMLVNEVYIGTTANYKTTTKSNKLKKQIHNDRKDWLIFENTHEAIIDKSTLKWCRSGLQEEENRINQVRQMCLPG